MRLYRQTTQDNNTVVGVVQLYKNDAWNFVCGTFFDDADAAVVCRKLGYGYSRALPAGAFGNVYYYRNVVGGVNCTGTEGSLGQCPMQDGSCQNTNYQNYGSVVCSKIPIPQGEGVLHRRRHGCIMSLLMYKKMPVIFKQVEWLP